MENNNKHWISKVEVTTARYLEDLRDWLNEFYKDKFIIATQVFPWDCEGVRNWNAIVYYKVKPTYKKPSKEVLVEVDEETRAEEAAAESEAIEEMKYKNQEEQTRTQAEIDKEQALDAVKGEND